MSGGEVLILFFFYHKEHKGIHKCHQAKNFVFLMYSFVRFVVKDFNVALFNQFK